MQKTPQKPGLQKRNTFYNLSVSHWNLNSINNHNLEKVDLLQAYNTVNKFDIICLSETYLDSSILSGNDNLVVKGYKLVRDYHSENIKRGRVCAYNRESLRVRCLFNTYLNKCFILEVRINNKRGYGISPSQTTDEFDLFMINLDTLLVDTSNRNLHFVLITGDFNAKSKN